MERALELLGEAVVIRGVSSFVRSKPYGVGGQPDFLNGVAYGYTSLKPYGLLRFLKSVERRLGRRERCRWCEREIDLDLIYYDGLKLSFDDLKVPHYDRLNRWFVIKPLAEILPTFVDPVVGKTARELALLT